jgi:TolB protein
MAISLLAVTILIPSISAKAAFPGSNGAIAFCRNGHIWTIQPDGTQTRLAKGGQPAWSADGIRIAYVHVDRRTGRGDIRTMLDDGTDKVRVTSSPDEYDSQPSWSPDGTHLVFTMYKLDGTRELYTIASQSPLASPVPITDTPTDEYHPAWSPDGTRIAFDVWGCGVVCSFDLGVVDPDGANYTLLTPGTKTLEREPDWSPDSSSLLYGSSHYRETVAHVYNFDVYRIAATGGPVTAVTSGGRDEWSGSAAWSPDGIRFVYSHMSARGGVRLWTANIDGSSAAVLCHCGTFPDASPDWQPLQP